MKEPKTVCVIGAGASGLTAVKCCLDEGLAPVCFEISDDVGGLWRYTPQLVGSQRASVMRSTVINTSKEMMAYSDFPMPADFPVFCHNSYVYRYLKLYADDFGVERYIRFRTEVVRVSKSPDYESTGRWLVRSRSLESGAESEETFDAVMLCTGHHATPYMPEFEGLGDFAGKVTHSHDYKTFEGHENKRVLVIGIGNSGGDIAVELANISEKVFLSTRRGAWVLNRISDSGHPIDMLFKTRFLMSVKRALPGVGERVFRYIIESRLNHTNYGLKPDHSPSAQHPMVNDSIGNKIAGGTLKIMPDVKRFAKTSVEFVDGSEEEIDAVIICTGYVFGFPYLEDGVIEVKKNELELYKFMYPPQLEHPTLAVIGCVQPLGAIMPISELQARWFCRILSGFCSLPSRDKMLQDIDKTKQEMAKTYYASPRHTIQVGGTPRVARRPSSHHDAVGAHVRRHQQGLQECVCGACSRRVGRKPRPSNAPFVDPGIGWRLFLLLSIRDLHTLMRAIQTTLLTLKHDSRCTPPMRHGTKASISKYHGGVLPFMHDSLHSSISIMMEFITFLS